MPLLSKKSANNLRHWNDSRGQHGTCSWAACTANITNAMPKAFQGLSLLPTRRNTVYQSCTRTFGRCGPCCFFHKRGQCRAGLKHLFFHRRKDNRAFSRKKTSGDNVNSQARSQNTNKKTEKETRCKNLKVDKKKVPMRRDTLDAKGQKRTKRKAFTL